jgi:hypothetical protein
MKRFLAVVVLITISVETFTLSANAGPNGGRYAAERVAGCTYDGYPCSQWEQMQDGW